MTCRTVREHVSSGTGRYGAWLLQQGWTGDVRHPETQTPNWHELRTNNGAHAGATPRKP